MIFTKMHGLGNDYVYVNCFEAQISDPAALARVISDRHTGVGSDGLILILPSDKADARMRIYNADGSEAEMCGNGLRCVAKFTYEQGLAGSRGPFTVPGMAQSPFNASLALETGNGVLLVGLTTDAENQVTKICVDMGEPKLTPAQIPVTLPGDRVMDAPIHTDLGEFRMTCVSMGNPHAVLFTEDTGSTALAQVGPAIETHALFPNRTNAHWVQVMGPHEIRMITWERGSGITQACGTGACACCVAGVLTGKTQRDCTAHLPGGDLHLLWNEQDNHVYMTGPAVEVFQGTWPDPSSQK
ncbi:MAG: diaminopimelate epimerase [Phycisphaerae bacterium]|nr:diaminopimelate epimerase [Phycisphaerae bacterium]